MRTAVFWLALFSFAGCATLPNKPPAFDAAAIDAEVLRLMAAENV